MGVQSIDVFSNYGGSEDPLAAYGGGLIPIPDSHTIQFHWKLADALFQPARYKVLEGGRGGMKSWGVARALLMLALKKRVRILCAREFMSSIEDSVYKLLKDQILAMNMSPWFNITKRGITAYNGSEFTFIGLGDITQKMSRTKIKSFEGIDVCWVEEAETITDESWQLLIPTIRKQGSEIWIVYNPNLESDATYKRFQHNPPPGTIHITMNWRDNLWMSPELVMEKDHLFAVDPEAAAHVWDGELRKHAEAAIMRGKYSVHNFETPFQARFYHGVDWGYSQDPTVMVRMFITGTPPYEELWIDREAWGIGVEINELARNPLIPDMKPGLFDKIESARVWPIKADSARPEHISYLRRNAGLRISAAEKWDGSVVDGIKHLRGFVQIHIHKDNCPHTAEEFKLYSYKIDRMTGEVLPIIMDKFNHCVDAVRYALSDFIQERGKLGIWRRLAQ
jgi:phage terminase large subunit